MYSLCVLGLLWIWHLVAVASKVKQFYEDIIDHGSYSHNLKNCEIKGEKKNQTLTRFEPMASAIPMQCSTD